MHLTKVRLIVLAAFLQLSPMLRIRLPSLLFSAPPPLLLKWLVGTLLIAGPMHAVSGATSLASEPTLEGTVGEEVGYQAILNTDDRGDYFYYGAVGVSPTPRDLSIIGLTMSLDGFLSGAPNRAGTFRIRVSGYENSNKSGYSGSATITLTVQAAAALAITSEPTDLTVNAGDSATFTVTATGPTRTYQWLKDNVEIANATDTSYSIFATDPTDAGLYSARVTSGASVVTSRSARLTVVVPITPPLITSTPETFSVHPGESISIVPSNEGSEPLTFTWLRNGEIVADATTASLHIASAAPADSGEYRLKIVNGGGAVEDTVAQVTVVPLASLAAPAGPDSIAVSWESIAGRHYSLESAHALDSVNWTEVASEVGDGGRMSRSLMADSGIGFIRVRAQSQ